VAMVGRAHLLVLAPDVAALTLRSRSVLVSVWMVERGSGGAGWG
jgi:hypothetical protein